MPPHKQDCTSSPDTLLAPYRPRLPLLLSTDPLAIPSLPVLRLAPNAQLFLLWTRSRSPSPPYPRLPPTRPPCYPCLLLPPHSVPLPFLQPPVLGYLLQERKVNLKSKSTLFFEILRFSMTTSYGTCSRGKNSFIFLQRQTNNNPETNCMMRQLQGSGTAVTSAGYETAHSRVSYGRH